MLLSARYQHSGGDPDQYVSDVSTLSDAGNGVISTSLGKMGVISTSRGKMGMG